MQDRGSPLWMEIDQPQQQQLLLCWWRGTFFPCRSSLPRMRRRCAASADAEGGDSATGGAAYAVYPSRVDSVSSMDQVESKVWAALKLPGEGDWDAMRFPSREQLDGFECFLHHD